MAIHYWDRMDNEKLIIKVEPKEFVMNTLRNLVFRLNYKQDLDLGGLNTQNLAQCLQYLILIPHRAMFNKREKNGSRSAQKRWQYLLIIYSIPSTSESYNCMTAGKGLYQMISLNNFKILKLDLQTHQGKCSLD